MDLLEPVFLFGGHGNKCSSDHWDYGSFDSLCFLFQPLVFLIFLMLLLGVPVVWDHFIYHHCLFCMHVLYIVCSQSKRTEEAKKSATIKKMSYGNCMKYGKTREVDGFNKQSSLRELSPEFFSCLVMLY